MVCVLSKVGWKTTRVFAIPGVRSSEVGSTSSRSSSPKELSDDEDIPGEIVRVVVSNSLDRCHSGRFESQSMSQS